MAGRCFRFRLSTGGQSMQKRPARQLALVSMAALLCVAAQGHSQTLDQKAYDAVWDRLEQILPDGTATENVHALRIIVPATWTSDSDNGLLDLQNIAGAIPAAEFSTDPSRIQLLLHRMYADYVLDIDLPQQTAEQQREYLAANDAYDRAYEAFMDRAERYNRRWEAYKAEESSAGRQITSQTRLRFREENSGFFTGVQGRLDIAAANLQRFAPVGSAYNQAIRRMRDAVADEQSVLRGIYPYDGGADTLRALSDCDDNNPAGWDEIAFTSTTNSQRTRSSGWNGGGSWSGAFFSLGGGGGGTNYSNVVQNQNESVILRFCNLTYVPLRPRNWFDPSILQAIDSGSLRLKSGSPMRGQRVFGADGRIPRLVKGAIVARRVMFMANLSQDRLDEMRSNSGGNGGVRIGPFRIGGGGGSTEFRREYTSQSGRYGRSTLTTVPVIIAIVTEPTE